MDEEHKCAFHVYHNEMHNAVFLNLSLSQLRSNFAIHKTHKGISDAKVFFVHSFYKNMDLNNHRAFPISAMLPLGKL